MNAAKFPEAIKELREMGVQVRISHLRRFKMKRPYADGGLMSVGGFNALPEETFKPNDLYVVDPCGGMTICHLYLVVEGAAALPQLIVETAIECHKRDHYNKRIGRTKALGHALHALTQAQAEGKLRLPVSA